MKSKFLRKAGKTISKHSPAILTTVAVIGTVTTTICACKDTLKAHKILEEKRLNDEELTAKEVVKSCWKCYIPTAISLTTTVACTIGANKAAGKKTALAFTAYKGAETALLDYQGKVKEVLGEKKEKEIRDKITEDKIAKNPPTSSNVVVIEADKPLCYDVRSDRYFRASRNKIDAVSNAIYGRLLSQDYASLNDVYDELGLNHIQDGNLIGWYVNDLNGERFELKVTPAFTPDGELCMAIEFSHEPDYDFDIYN